MVLVFLPLFMGVGYADNTEDEWLLTDVDRIKSYLEWQGYKITTQHVENLLDWPLDLQEIIGDLNWIKLTEKDKEAISTILNTTWDDDIDRMFAEIDEITERTNGNYKDADANYKDADANYKDAEANYKDAEESLKRVEKNNADAEVYWNIWKAWKNL